MKNLSLSSILGVALSLTLIACEQPQPKTIGGGSGSATDLAASDDSPIQVLSTSNILAIDCDPSNDPGRAPVQEISNNAGASTLTAFLATQADHGAAVGTRLSADIISERIPLIEQFRTQLRANQWFKVEFNGRFNRLTQQWDTTNGFQNPDTIQIENSQLCSRYPEDLNSEAFAPFVQQTYGNAPQDFLRYFNACVASEEQAGVCLGPNDNLTGFIGYIQYNEGGVRARSEKRYFSFLQNMYRTYSEVYDGASCNLEACAGVPRGQRCATPLWERPGTLFAGSAPYKIQFETVHKDQAVYDEASGQISYNRNNGLLTGVITIKAMGVATSAENPQGVPFVSQLQRLELTFLGQDRIVAHYLENSRFDRGSRRCVPASNAFLETGFLLKGTPLSAR